MTPPPVIAIEVQANDQRGDEWLNTHGGSAFVDDRGLLTTASHATVKGREATALALGGGSATLHDIDGWVCHGPARGVNAPRLRIADGAPPPGAYATWWGTSYKWRPVTDLVEVQKVTVNWVYTSIPPAMEEGASGGPLLDHEGKVCGVLISKNRSQARFRRLRR